MDEDTDEVGVIEKGRKWHLIIGPGRGMPEAGVTVSNLALPLQPLHDVPAPVTCDLDVMPRSVRVLAAVVIDERFHVVEALVARLGNKEVRPAKAVNHSDKLVDSLRPEGARSRYLRGKGLCDFFQPFEHGHFTPLSSTRRFARGTMAVRAQRIVFVDEVVAPPAGNDAAGLCGCARAYLAARARIHGHVLLFANALDSRVGFEVKLGPGALVQPLHESLTGVFDVAVGGGSGVGPMKLGLGFVVDSGEKVGLQRSPEARVDLIKAQLDVPRVVHGWQLLRTVVSPHVATPAKGKQMHRPKHFRAVTEICGVAGVRVVVHGECSLHLSLAARGRAARNPGQ